MRRRRTRRVSESVVVQKAPAAQAWQPELVSVSQISGWATGRLRLPQVSDACLHRAVREAIVLHLVLCSESLHCSTFCQRASIIATASLIEYSARVICVRCCRRCGHRLSSLASEIARREQGSCGRRCALLRPQSARISNAAHSPPLPAHRPHTHHPLSPLHSQPDHSSALYILHTLLLPRRSIIFWPSHGTLSPTAPNFPPPQ